jgi:hypothetical protein
MEKIGEEHISEFILNNNNNNKRIVLLNSGGNVDHISFLTREDIDINKFRTLKTLGGCCTDFIALTKLITEIEEHQEEDVDVDDDIDENNNNVPETNNYNEDIVDEQTNPYESERFFSEFTSKLPQATTTLKHQNNATTLRQA